MYNFYATISVIVSCYYRKKFGTLPHIHELLSFTFSYPVYNVNLRNGGLEEDSGESGGSDILVKMPS